MPSASVHCRLFSLLCLGVSLSPVLCRRQTASTSEIRCVVVIVRGSVPAIGWASATAAPLVRASGAPNVAPSTMRDPQTSVTAAPLALPHESKVENEALFPVLAGFLSAGLRPGLSRAGRARERFRGTINLGG